MSNNDTKIQATRRERCPWPKRKKAKIGITMAFTPLCEWSMACLRLRSLTHKRRNWEQILSGLIVLGEENAMDAVIARIFKPEIDKAAQRATNRTRKEVATDMLKDGMPLPKIIKFSRLPEATVKQLAKSLGVAVL